MSDLERKEEGSSVGGIKGFQAPMGAEPGKKKKKINPSSPYGDPELFEANVVSSELKNEVVKQVGDKWIAYDDDTGAQLGSSDTRKGAWEIQRRRRDQSKNKGSDERQRQKKSQQAFKAKGSETEKNLRRRKRSHHSGTEKVRRKFKKEGMTFSEAILAKLLNLPAVRIVETKGNRLSESALSYIFQSEPIGEETRLWEDFLKKLSRESLMADENMRGMLTKIAETEMRALGKSIRTIKEILEMTGAFSVSPGQPQHNPYTNEVGVRFDVAMNESGQKLGFGIKLENGKPLIVFPEASRHMLNKMATKESKLLRAELMHAQETALDQIEDVIKVLNRRDHYLRSTEGKLEKVLGGMNLLELSLLKNLMRKKYNSRR